MIATVAVVVGWAAPVLAGEPERVVCVEDSDCGGNQACVRGEGGAWCAEATLTGARCDITSDCNGGQVCTSDGAGGRQCADVGEFVLAVLCQLDTDCADDELCAPNKVCEEGDRDPPPPCGSDDDCEAGQLCAVGGVCKDAEGDGGGCSVAPGASQWPAGLVMIGLIWLASRRRRFR